MSALSVLDAVGMLGPNANFHTSALCAGEASDIMIDSAGIRDLHVTAGIRASLIYSRLIGHAFSVQHTYITYDITLKWSALLTHDDQKVHVQYLQNCVGWTLFVVVTCCYVLIFWWNVVTLHDFSSLFYNLNGSERFRYGVTNLSWGC